MQLSSRGSCGLWYPGEGTSALRTRTSKALRQASLSRSPTADRRRKFEAGNGTLSARSTRSTFCGAGGRTSSVVVIFQPLCDDTRVASLNHRVLCQSVTRLNCVVASYVELRTSSAACLPPASPLDLCSPWHSPRARRLRFGAPPVCLREASDQRSIDVPLVFVSRGSLHCFRWPCPLTGAGDPAPVAFIFAISRPGRATLSGFPCVVSSCSLVASFSSVSACPNRTFLGNAAELVSVGLH